MVKVKKVQTLRAKQSFVTKAKVPPGSSKDNLLGLLVTSSRQKNDYKSPPWSLENKLPPTNRSLENAAKCCLPPSTPVTHQCTGSQPLSVLGAPSISSPESFVFIAFHDAFSLLVSVSERQGEFIPASILASDRRFFKSHSYLRTFGVTFPQERSHWWQGGWGGTC